MVLIVEGGVRYRCLLFSSRIIDIFFIVTNGTAADIDGDMSMLVISNVWNLLAVIGICRSHYHRHYQP